MLSGEEKVYVAYEHKDYNATENRVHSQTYHKVNNKLGQFVLTGVIKLTELFAPPEQYGTRETRLVKIEFGSEFTSSHRAKVVQDLHDVTQEIIPWNIVKKELIERAKVLKC